MPLYFCCIVGCSGVNILLNERKLSINGTILNEGDWITLNGSSGNVYKGQIPLKEIDLKSNKYFQNLMAMTDRHRRLDVRTNADSPDDALQAREFGAKGIGLCRTEHMFFDPERILAMREMIIAENKLIAHKTEK